MSFSEKQIDVSVASSFSDLVDDTCEQLMDRRIQYSIRRIGEMENLLNVLEQELNQFLFAKNRN